MSISLSRFRQILEWSTVFCGVFLVVIWPLSGTIAARNSALVLGSVSSLIWLFFYRPNLNLSTYVPQFCLLAVPIWLWAHYFFIPKDAVAQWDDLSGTWLRVILGVLFATGLGFMASACKRYQIYIWGAMIGLVMATLGMYLYEAIAHEILLIPNFKAFYKYKSAVVYFLTWPLLLAYALLHIRVIKANDEKSLNFHNVSGLFILISSCWAMFIASQALNGILIATFMGVALIGIFVKSSLIDRTSNKHYRLFLLGIFVAILVGAMAIFLQYDQKHGKKLTNLIDDIRISAQIDKHDAWQKNVTDGNPVFPVNQYGKPPHESTYERTSWFIKGAQLLIAHPEGSGFSHLAFRYFIQQENPRFDVNATHSGWLDFALGVGIPGVILTWFAIALIAFRAMQLMKKYNSSNIIENSLITLWVLGGIWLLWWPAELSEREFIEHFYFMVAFLAGLNSANTSLVHADKNYL